jgi:hypothetical protein
VGEDGEIKMPSRYRRALIEFFRGSPQAADWLTENKDEVVGIPVIVLMELLQGARSAAEQASIREWLEAFSVQHLETGDSQRALEWFAAYRLSHGTGIMDCLSPPSRRGLPSPSTRSMCGTSDMRTCHDCFPIFQRRRLLFGV